MIKFLTGIDGGYSVIGFQKMGIALTGYHDSVSNFFHYPVYLAEPNLENATNQEICYSLKRDTEDVPNPDSLCPALFLSAKEEAIIIKAITWI